jgi:hypothetical protein
MGVEMPKPNAVFVYSEKDELLRQSLADYLLMLQERGLLGEVRYYCLESFGTSRLTQLIEQADIFLFLFSVSLMTNLPPGVAALEELSRQHKLKRLKLIALLSRAWDVADTPFQGAITLPEGQRPILSNDWSSPHQAYEHIFEKLQVICQETADYKVALELAWQDAVTQHEEGSYFHFLQSYPFSKYTKKAKAAINRLQEDELWQEALQQGSVESYAQYLIKSPLHEQVKEASNWIDETEESEAANWAEAEKQGRAEFFFRYKAAFHRGNHLEKANQKIKELLSKQVPIDGRYASQLASNYLMHRAYRKLEPEAIFALDSYLKYCWLLRTNVDRLALNQGSNRLVFLLFYGLFFLSEFFILNSYGFFWGEGDSLGLKILKIGAIATSNLLLLRQMYWSMGSLALDVRFLENARGFLRRAAVQLKVSFLANDIIRVQQILTLLVQVEQKASLIEKKNILQYLASTRPSEGQATIREEYAKPWQD